MKISYLRVNGDLRKFRILFRMWQPDKMTVTQYEQHWAVALIVEKHPN